jgi:hypothetical protein
MDSMIKACPACGIVRKCTLESSMPAVQREHAAVQRAVADHMNTTVFTRLLLTRLLLTGCGALEQASEATKLPPNVKARVDLQGFTHAVAHDPAVAENLKLIIAQYPELTKLLTPEAKLGIALLTAAVTVAATNAAKKSSDPGSPSDGGESESKP